MNDGNLTALIEGLFMAVIANLILFIGYFTPFIGILIMMITPIPFVVMMLRRPIKYTGYAIGMGTLLAFLLMPFPLWLMLPLYGGVVGLVMGACIGNKVSASKTILYTGIAATISAFVVLTLFQFAIGDTVANALMAEYQNIRTTLMGDGSLSDQLIGTEKELLMIVTTLLPAMMTTTVFLAVLANYYLARDILKRLGVELIAVESFSRFRYPNSMIYGVTFMLILSYISGYLGLVNPDLLLANIVILVLYLLMGQGLAIVYYLLEKIDIPKNFRILIIAGLLIFQVGPILSIIGWIDSIIDFRAIHRRKLPKD